MPVDGPAVRVSARRGKLRRRTLIVVTVVFVVFCAATARLFVWPDQGMPSRVDAIVMLDSPGRPLNVAVGLAKQHRAPFLVVSQGTPASRDPCPQPVPEVTLICFNPTPPTTRGEAEFVGRLAKTHHWHSIAVVAITPQDSRARLRVARCFPGRVYVVTAPIRLSIWPYQVSYEWAALVKALSIERSC